MYESFPRLGLVLIAAVAIGMATASAASATSVAWLVNGEAVASALAVEASEELLLEDNKVPLVGKVAILCSSIMDGVVGPGGEGELQELLNLSKTAISLVALSGTALSCTNETDCESSKVWAVHLPWVTSLELVEELSYRGFANISDKGTGGSPGWYVECTVLGIKESDECVAEPTGAAEVTNVGAGVEAVFSTAFTELLEFKLATCSLSKEESGTGEGNGIVTTNGLGTLSVSSESVAAPEWRKGGAVINKKINFTVTTSGVTELEVSAGTWKVTCQQGSGKGELEAPGRIKKLQIAFSQCLADEGVKNCEAKNVGNANKEEIIMKELEGVVRTVAKAEAATERGAGVTSVIGQVVAIEAMCVNMGSEGIVGTVIGELVKPKTDKKEVLEGEVSFAISATKEQKIQKFENGKKEVLSGKESEMESPFKSVQKWAFAEEVEIT